ncbi:MAG: hypothetical protein AAF213_12355, partial [Pseudomonadota bacterium]
AWGNSLYDATSEQRCVEFACSSVTSPGIGTYVKEVPDLGQQFADANPEIDYYDPFDSGWVLDGGILGSKPYASSGKYIDRMSNYCSGCAYNVKEGTGEGACPFNYLYWDFLMRNQETLAGNQRMSMIFATLRKMKDEKKEAIQADAKRFFDRLEPSQDSWYARSRQASDKKEKKVSHG